jgi:transposase
MRLRARLKVPRPSHVEKDPAEVKAFQEQFDQRMTALVGPERKPLYLWVEDEHRYGLNTIIRPVWTLEGYRPTAPYQKKRVYGDLYGALELGTGDIQLLYTPSVSLNATGVFLEQLKATHPEGIHVVIYDRAGWHPLAGDPSLPEGVRILPLPAYSPELNPVETLWEPVKRAAANAVSRTLEQAERVIDNALRPFWEHTTRVCRLLGKYWIALAGAAYLGHPCGAKAM